MLFGDYEKEEIEKLERIIKEQSEKYYTDGTQTLTDVEFDNLVDRLRLLNPTSKILQVPRMGLQTNRA